LNTANKNLTLTCIGRVELQSFSKTNHTVKGLL